MNASSLRAGVISTNRGWRASVIALIESGVLASAIHLTRFGVSFDLAMPSVGCFLISGEPASDRWFERESDNVTSRPSKSRRSLNGEYCKNGGHSVFENLIAPTIGGCCIIGTINPNCYLHVQPAASGGGICFEFLEGSRF